MPLDRNRWSERFARLVRRSALQWVHVLVLLALRRDWAVVQQMVLAGQVSVFHPTLPTHSTCLQARASCNGALLHRRQLHPPRPRKCDRQNSDQLGCLAKGSWQGHAWVAKLQSFQRSIGSFRCRCEPGKLPLARATHHLTRAERVPRLISVGLAARATTRRVGVADVQPTGTVTSLGLVVRCCRSHPLVPRGRGPPAMRSPLVSSALERQPHHHDR